MSRFPHFRRVLFPVSLAIAACGASQGLVSTAFAATSAPAVSTAAQARGTGGKIMRNVLLTFYGYDDNDDGMGKYGTEIISDPIIHRVAMEDLGTYDHPSTFATDYRIAKAGTRIYIPKVRKYFIMEDTCVECTADVRKGRKRIDLYIGEQKLQGKKLINCENNLTGDGYHDVVVVNPSADWPVETAPLYKAGHCESQLYPTP